jgi:prolyl-tRNA editing enzyme YbaK/EbsC (Cys-tRNA(Pro) deacylase)
VHPNVEVVVRAAAARGVDIEPREFPDGTRTADDAARAIGVEVGQIVKSLVFLVGDDAVLALVSGANQLDERALGALAGGDGKARRADADAVRAATGFPIGGVPPFGHPATLPTYLDEDLLAFDTVWAAAGTPRHNFGIRPPDLLTVTGATVAHLARR